MAILFLPLVAGRLSRPGVFQFQRGKGQAVDEQDHVDFFERIGKGIAYLPCAAEDVIGKVLFNLFGTACQRCRVNQAQVSVIDIQTLF